jgi:sugar transferase (PEP-CTERM system associated)
VRIFRHYVSWSVFSLVAIEIAIVFFSVYVGWIFSLPHNEIGLKQYKIYYLRAFFIAFVSAVTFYIADLYNLSWFRKKRELLSRIVPCFFIIGMIVFSISLVFHDQYFSRNIYLLAFSIMIPMILGCRFVYYFAVNTRGLRDKVLILGTTKIAQQLLEELHRDGNPEFDVLGLVSEGPCSPFEALAGRRILGDVHDLERILRQHTPDIVVVALSERRGNFPSKEILDCKMQGIRVEDWPSFYEKLTGKIHVHNLRPSWLIFADGFARSDFVMAVKFCIDMALALIGLCLALPFMIICAVLIKLDSAGPVFFRQERVGEHGKVFSIIKFRTMVADAEKDTGPVWAQNVDPRVTRVGHLLRRTGMDEMPQLLNVLKGEMSFVGPRPERPPFVAELQQQLPYYTQRLVVKPGITGWAQVRYGYGATIEDSLEKLQYDLYYIKNMSIFLDFLIILSTIHKVVFAKVALQESVANPATGLSKVPAPSQSDELERLSPSLNPGQPPEMVHAGPGLSPYEDSVMQ